MSRPTPIRNDVVWPALLVPPQRPPAIVYLDQNHFVNLAKVVAGKPTRDGYPELLAAARNALSSGRAVFPLSATHLMETSNVGDAKRRADVANMMAELSGFNYLLGRPLVIQLEIEASLSLVVGRDLTTVGPVDLIGYGGLWPFGMHSPRITISDATGQDTTEQVRTLMGPEVFDDMTAEAERVGQLHMLNGGDSGHAQGSWRAALDARAQREVGQVTAIDTEPIYRQNGQLRDVINAAEAYVELNEYLKAGVDRSELDPLQMFPTPADARRFSDGMPSTRVAVSLKTHFHRNRAAQVGYPRHARHRRARRCCAVLRRGLHRRRDVERLDVVLRTEAFRHRAAAHAHRSGELARFAPGGALSRTGQSERGRGGSSSRVVLW